MSSRAQRGICFSLLFTLAAGLFLTASLRAQEPRRPRIFGIAEVQLYSTNKPAADAFFSASLDAECLTKAPCPWSHIAEKEFSLRKRDQDQNLELVTSPDPIAPNLLHKVVFSTDSLEALKAYLGAKKVVITRVSNHYLEMNDPEGRAIAFIEIDASDRDAPWRSNNLRLVHAGFVVHDRAAMDHFYKDILGFRLYWHGGMVDRSAVAHEKDADDWVDMQVPDGTDWIEYMLNVSPNADKRELGVMNHIALGVRDIHAAEQQLLRNGLKLTEQPQIGRDGKWQLNLYDPDGTRVELMEFTPVQKPCCADYTGPHPGPRQ